MNKSINLATFFLALTPWVCIAQLNSTPKKIVLNHKIGYYCTVRNLDHSILLTRFDLESPDRDSIYIFDKPSGVFESHPLVWDVLDSFIFQIRIRTSADKSQYSELRVYLDDKVRKHAKKGNGYDYIASQNTFYDNSLPLNSYIRRINNQEDTLTGPIYFDILAKPDSLLLYIYLNDSRKIEVWSFVRYPILVGKSNSEANKIIMKKKKWELVYTISADINSPFQLIQSTDRLFALTISGDLLDLSGTYAKIIQSSSSLKDHKGIIVNKKLASAKYINIDNWYLSRDNFSVIYQSAKNIITN